MGEVRRSFRTDEKEKFFLGRRLEKSEGGDEGKSGSTVMTRGPSDGLAGWREVVVSCHPGNLWCSTLWRRVLWFTEWVE